MFRASEPVNWLSMSFLRIAIGVLALLLLAVPALVWTLMAPVVSSLPQPSDISVDPVRLREHVEILSGGKWPGATTTPKGSTP